MPAAALTAALLLLPGQAVVAALAAAAASTGMPGMILSTPYFNRCTYPCTIWVLGRQQQLQQQDTPGQPALAAAAAAATSGALRHCLRLQQCCNSQMQLC
jgi:hypothetical protein